MSQKIITSIITTTIIPTQTPALKIAPIASQLLNDTTNNVRRKMFNFFVMALIEMFVFVLKIVLTFCNCSLKKNQDGRMLEIIG